jgi:hypothetical protein
MWENLVVQPRKVEKYHSLFEPNPDGSITLPQDFITPYLSIDQVKRHDVNAPLSSADSYIDAAFNIEAVKLATTGLHKKLIV